MSKYPTIVTMMYDIRKMENCTNERNRKLESYIDFSKKFLLTLPYPMILFISPDDSYTKDAILKVRGDLGLMDKTFIYELEFKYTYFYRHLSRLEELQRSFFILNGDIQHETPLYVILNNNKLTTPPNKHFTFTNYQQNCAQYYLRPTRFLKKMTWKRFFQD